MVNFLLSHSQIMCYQRDATLGKADTNTVSNCISNKTNKSIYMASSKISYIILFARGPGSAS